MGVKGLNTIVKKYAPQCMTEIHISMYAYQKVAVDTSLYMFKYKVIFGDRWLTAFVNLVGCLRKNNIHPVFVFDSKAPVEKEDEKKKRQEKRDKQQEKIDMLELSIQTYHSDGTIDEILMETYNKTISEQVSRLLGGPNKTKSFDIRPVEEEFRRMKSKVVSIADDDFKTLKELFTVLDIQFIQAPSEAEAYGSYLCSIGQVDAVLSEDTDVLAYGCPKFLVKLDAIKGTCTEIDINTLYECLELTYSSFVDLCIMCGTDYNTNMKGIGPEKAYKLVKQYGCLEAIEEAGYPVECLNYIRVRELYKFDLKNDVHVRFCGKPQWTELYKFFARNNIRMNVDQIKRNFEPPSLEFED